MRKKIIIGILSLIIISLLVWNTSNRKSRDKNMATVHSGPFETYVTVTGELITEKALDITVPEVCFKDELEIWAIKILSVVEEGKIVKKGDHVAMLEPKEAEEKLILVNEELNKAYSNLEDAKIDSTLTLAANRETIKKERDRVIDAEIKVQQSSFESKAIQRQVKIELEKTKRSLSKSNRDLVINKKRHNTLISRHVEHIKKYEYKKALLEQLRSEMNIKAPADGMIIYGRGYNGQKVKAGTQVGRWAPLIATLPDLNTIISELYVKEIDIAKISTGQNVKIKIDAFPKKKFSGEIIKIANIGRDIPGTSQIGFPVKVQLSDHKEKLLPGMTTSNTIITNRFENTLFIPKESVFGNDTLKYVLKKSGLKIIKQEVKTGKENDTHFQITAGLKQGDKLLTNQLKDYQDKEIIKL